jgi:hypothetical protein
MKLKSDATTNCDIAEGRDRPKAVVRLKAKFWPKAEIRPKAKLQPKRPFGIAVAPFTPSRNILQLSQK